MEDALLYRWQTVQAKRPLWVRTLSRLAYPMLVFSPCLYAYFRPMNDFKVVLFLSLFLHFFYLCAGSLAGTITAFSQEKQKRTFESLVTTGLTAKQWLSSTLKIVLKPLLTDLFLYSLIWLPLLQKLNQQGSYDGHPAYMSRACLNLVLLLIISTVSIISHSALGCFLSLRARSTQAAQMQASVIFTVLFFLLIPLDVMLVDRILHCNNPVLSCLSPWICFIFQADQRHDSALWTSAANAAFHVVAAICLFDKSLWTLKNPQVVTNAVDSVKAVVNASDTLAGMDNPILYRSYLAHRRRPWAFWAKLAAGPCIALSMRYGLPFLSGGSHRSDLEGGLLLSLAICFIGLTVQAISGGVEAFSADKDRGTFESLQLTKLKPGALFRSQWLVTVLPLLLQTVVLAPFWLFYVRDICELDYCSSSGLSFDNALWLGLYGLGWTLFASSITLWFSQRSSSAGAALTKSVGLVFFLVIGLPIVDGLILNDFKILAPLGPVVGLIGLTENHYEKRCVVGLAFYLVMGLLALWRASVDFNRPVSTTNRA